MGVAVGDENISSAPKVSIIVPVYNSEKYILTCLQSLMAQTLPDIEIIAVNDGSTDNTLAIMNDCARCDRRIKIIDQSNQKTGIARNNGMKIAAGEYIGFVDADDWVDKDFFEKLYLAARESNADIALASYTQTGNNKKRKRLNITEETIVNSMQDKIDICHLVKRPGATNKIYRKTMLTANRIAFAGGCAGEDRIFSIKALYYANAVVAVPNVFYCYRPVKRKLTQEMIDDQNAADAAVLNFLKIKEADVRDGEFRAVKREIRFKGICLFRHEISLASEKYIPFGITVFNIEIL